MLLSTPPLLVEVPSEHIFRSGPTVSAQLQILKEIILEAGRDPRHTVCEMNFTATQLLYEHVSFSHTLHDL